GFDAITGGGLPRGRTALVCGGAGCGKTLFAMEFIVNGATAFGEPGVVIAFEESAAELTANVKSLGFDLARLQRDKMLAIDFVKIDRSETQETGDYDLEGLFVRLAHAIDSVRAKRVALDSLEALFGGFTDESLLRSELRRLFRWLKDRGVTAVITGEQGNGMLTRYGLEEYVSDCVIALDNRVVDQISTRRLRIVKYRGSAHGSNEYPFLIDEHGFSVLPVTTLGLDYAVSSERVPTGVKALDQMLEGGGYFRGSSVLISGTAGTGKSSISAMFADASCRRRERTIYFALEESARQVVRNMGSIGLDLAKWEDKKLLQILASRPTVYGLEMHLLKMQQAIEQFEPRAIVVDPISSLVAAGRTHEVKSMMVRLFDYLKMKQITAVVTSLATALDNEESAVGISSLIDSWLQVRDQEVAGERTRSLHVVKSRGMGHSNQVREFVITAGGIEVLPVAVGPLGVLTGSGRIQQETDQKAGDRAAQLELARRTRHLERMRTTLDAQIEALRADYASEEDEAKALIAETREREQGERASSQGLSQRRSGLSQRRSA
ncbi:MAG: circadian clock protein KaiC, partial [Deltaproteobacteria bacterium]|nr:circadian clock protein KaiC [Nannocystaceae bacterium]